MKFHFHATGAAILVLALFITSCSKPAAEEQEQPVSLGNETSATDVGIMAINGSFSENWNSYTHGTQYSQSQAEADFGNISGWNAGRSMISNGNLRITLEPNALSGAGGVVSNIDVSDGSEYQVSFTIRFHSAFDWSRGGKLGFGLLIGDGNTGGDPGWDGNGGSFRLMWYNNNGRIYFHPYVYHRDQAGNYGDNFGVSYPSSGSLAKSQTYNVTLYAKSNTGSNTNGRARLIINGTTVLDRAMRWTTNDSKRLIRNISFHTFRGGSQSYWMSSSVGYVYYDDLVVTRIN
ncbi:polysaccharide lyase [Chitinophaga sp. YIM B06452]|uniref:polysaccharide lyase n=1 Tax=Chitinophaga sp. YIM B06452 TaxID=3082158 RepID=UPI0031FE4C68